MRTNKLSLNASKSEYMVIGHRRQLNRVDDDLPDLVLNNEIIKRVDKAKYLGINIDESLNWKEQYKTIKNKLKGGLSSLRKLKTILPQKKLDQVYKALFESHLRYGDIVLEFSSQHQAVPTAATTDKGKEANCGCQV